MIDTTALHSASGAQPFSGVLAWRAQSFAHPTDVVASPALTLEEKREILASWASDACAVESAPALRLYPGMDRPVWIDDVLDALRSLDVEAGFAGGPERSAAPYRQASVLGKLSS